MKMLLFCLVIIGHSLTAYASDVNQYTPAQTKTVSSINKFAAELSNDQSKSEDWFMVQLRSLQQDIADLGDYEITLIKSTADQAYSQEKYQLFSAITGLLNDYYLLNNNPIIIEEKLQQLERIGVVEQLDDSIRVELEIDRLLSWNHLYRSNKTIGHIDMLDTLEKTSKQEVKVVNLFAEALSKSGNL